MDTRLIRANTILNEPCNPSKKL